MKSLDKKDKTEKPDQVARKLDQEKVREMALTQLYRSAHLVSIGTLASGIAHEINNALTAVLGFSSALLARIKKNEEIDSNELGSYLQIVYDETIRCRDIVEQFYRFARQSGETKIGRVSLAGCITDALRFVKVRATRSEVTIVNEMQDDCWVWTDAGRLELVFISLLTNCIDFCGPGTTVTVSKVSGGKTPSHAVVAVSDNGPGMTAEVLGRAVDPFFTTKEEGKGTGLGLAICHRLMEELNGRIDIASEAGKGTIVRLAIPCVAEPASGERA